MLANNERTCLNAFMSDKEQKPFEYVSLEIPDLNQLAGEELDDLIEVLADGVEGMDMVSKFIDPDFEAAWPAGMNLASAMAQSMTGEASDDEAFRTAYRSLHFAYTVGDILLKSNAELKFQEFFKDIETTEQMRTMMIDAAAGYYALRGSLDIVSSRFVCELDPTGQYGDLADTVTGMTFMFIEEAVRQRYADMVVDGFRQQDIDKEVAEFSRRLDEL
jgi:hypothetical protein